MPLKVAFSSPALRPTSGTPTTEPETERLATKQRGAGRPVTPAGGSTRPQEPELAAQEGVCARGWDGGSAAACTPAGMQEKLRHPFEPMET